MLLQGKTQASRQAFCATSSERHEVELGFGNDYAASGELGVPVRDPEAIAEKTNRLSESSKKLAEMSLHNFEFSKASWPGAQETAKKDFSRIIVEKGE